MTKARCFRKPQVRSRITKAGRAFVDKRNPRYSPRIHPTLQIIRRPPHATMQPSSVGLISRSSSAALSMAQQPTIFDDMNIAAGLLTEPKDPRHRSSFTGISFVGLDGSDNLPQRSDGQLGGHHEGRSRRAVRTSNTWTSSSGDVLSDLDDVDDRTVFVQEYNRLARKVQILRAQVDESTLLISGYSMEYDKWTPKSLIHSMWVCPGQQSAVTNVV